jgi:hypothetical protein
MEVVITTAPDIQKTLQIHELRDKQHIYICHKIRHALTDISGSYPLITQKKKYPPLDTFRTSRAIYP